MKLLSPELIDFTTFPNKLALSNIVQIPASPPDRKACRSMSAGFFLVFFVFFNDYLQHGQLTSRYRYFILAVISSRDTVITLLIGICASESR